MSRTRSQRPVFFVLGWLWTASALVAAYFPAVLAVGDDAGAGFATQTAAAPSTQLVRRVAAPPQTSGQLLEFLRQQRARGALSSEVILIGCGAEDLRRSDVVAEAALAEYTANLPLLVREARALCREILWCNLPPGAAEGAVADLNRAAAEVMRREGVAMIDFHGFCRALTPATDTPAQRARFLTEAIAQWWAATARSNGHLIREPLWPTPDRIPAFEARGPEGINARARVGSVTVPEIVRFAPQTAASGTAVIFFPGGGYAYLGFPRNAQELAERLAPAGIAVIGLKYRTGRPPEVPLLDAARAVRYVRHHAKAWGIDPRRIGVAGQSAGAHLALNLAAHFAAGDPAAADPVERESSRPDFVAPLTSWNLGRTELPFHFAADTPPFFVRHARDDNGFPIAEAVVTELQRARIPVDAKFLTKGGHGAFELSPENAGFGWPEEFVGWLERMRLAPARAVAPQER